jgi:hypothetical protein
MRSFRALVPLLMVAALATGCDQQALLERFIPQEEAEFARQLLARLAAEDYESIEAQLDPRIRTPSARSTLEQMAALFPAEDPTAINTVGANTSIVDDVATYNLTFEHEYSESWLLAHVVLQKREGQLTILGLNVIPQDQPLQELNRFTFAGKSVLHYAVFALAIAIPAFIVYALVLCIRTPIAKRKWLWVIFVALGIVQLSLNWTDGSYVIQPLSFSILGAGFVRAGFYGPVILSVALPIGAIVFLARRRHLLAQNQGPAAA